MRTFLGRDKYDWAGFGLLCLVLGSMVAVMLSCEPAQAVEEYESIVTETVMMEAASEGLDGMIAVAEVIRNRAIKRYGIATYETMAKEVLRPKQFSCWNSHKWAKAWLESHGTGESFQRASRAIGEAITGSDTVKGATHYHTNAVKPYWVDSMRYIGTVGEHRFYKEGR